MRKKQLHAWDLSPKEAVEVQAALVRQLTQEWDARTVRTVAGVDVSVREGVSRSAIVVFSYPELEPLEAVTAEAPTVFPYVPGLLSFREGPVVLAAWDQLEHAPDLVLFDGQGIAHPRGIGLAAHLGLWIGTPTIGCAKSRLYGRYEEPAREKGAQSPLVDEKNPNRVIGSVLRTRTNVKPLFISPGNRIDIEHATDFVLRCCGAFRLPEPTRWAHRVAGGADLPTRSR